MAKGKLKSYNIGGSDTIQLEDQGRRHIGFNDRYFGDNFNMDVRYDNIKTIKFYPKTNKFIMNYIEFITDEGNTIGTIVEDIVTLALRCGVDFDHIPRVEFKPYNWEGHKNKRLTEMANIQEQIEGLIDIEEKRIEIIENTYEYEGEGYEEYTVILEEVKEIAEGRLERLNDRMRNVKRIVDREDEKWVREQTKIIINEFIESAKKKGFIIRKERFEHMGLGRIFERFPHWFARVPHKKKETFNKAIEILSKIPNIKKDDVTPENLWEAFKEHTSYWSRAEPYSDHMAIHIEEYPDDRRIYKEFRIHFWGKPELSLKLQDDKLEISEEYNNIIKNLKYDRDLIYISFDGRDDYYSLDDAMKLLTKPFMTSQEFRSTSIGEKQKRQEKKKKSNNFKIKK
jgi:hypothetical protein